MPDPEALALAGRIVAQARRMTQVPPDPVAPDHEWVCSACTFRTTDTRRACDHAVDTLEAMERDATIPFAHILYERPRGREGERAARARRRIHPVARESGRPGIRVMAPPRSDAVPEKAEESKKRPARRRRG